MNRNLLWLLIVWVLILFIAVREHSRAAFILPIFTFIGVIYMIYATIFLAKSPKPKDDSQANQPADPKNDASAK